MIDDDEDEDDDSDTDSGADEASDVDDGEIIAEIKEALDDLVEAELLELTSRKITRYLAEPLYGALERAPSLDIAEWLVDRPEVSEVYAESEDVHKHFARVFKRLGGAATPVKYNAALGASIIANPDDVQAWSVYGDWLIEQGDPRGELMAIQISRSANPGDKILGQQEAALLAKHRRHFYGDLWRDGDLAEGLRVGFRYGYFDEIHLAPEEEESVDVVDLLEDVLGLESTRFVRTLVIQCPQITPLQALFAKKPLPTTLTSLSIEDSYYGAVGEINLKPVVSGLKQLTKLHVVATEIVLPTLDGFDQLRELVLVSDDLIIDETALSSLRGLEQIVLDASSITVAAVHALYTKPPKKLSSFTMRGATSSITSGELVKQLIASPLARQLRVLDLRECEIDDATAMQLIEARPSMLRLDNLILESNPISPAVRERCEAVWKSSFTRGVEYRYDNGNE